MLAGVRPELFEDARIVHDVERPLKFRAKVDVVEEMGSELYAFFSLKADEWSTPATWTSSRRTPAPRRSGTTRARRW